MSARRYSCRCDKKRYRDEPSALAAAAADERAHGVPMTVYRCPGGLAWHLTAHGFTPGALRSVGRQLAYEMLQHGPVDLGTFRPRGRDPRRTANRMVALGLARRSADRLEPADPAGLARVVQVGLDAYAGERV